MFIFEVDEINSKVNIAIGEGSGEATTHSLITAGGLCVIRAAQLIEDNHPDIKVCDTLRIIADSLYDTAAVASGELHLLPEDERRRLFEDCI